jgi:hypothetical protein
MTKNAAGTQKMLQKSEKSLLENKKVYRRTKKWDREQFQGKKKVSFPIISDRFNFYAFTDLQNDSNSYSWKFFLV